MKDVRHLKKTEIREKKKKSLLAAHLKETNVMATAARPVGAAV